MAKSICYCTTQISELCHASLIRTCNSMGLFSNIILITIFEICILHMLSHNIKSYIYLVVKPMVSSKRYLCVIEDSSCIQFFTWFFKAIMERSTWYSHWMCTWPRMMNSSIKCMDICDIISIKGGKNIMSIKVLVIVMSWYKLSVEARFHVSQHICLKIWHAP